jgi:ATP-binding cassette, subfamily B, bacterial
MMSSRKDNLPPGFLSMWRLCKLGYRHEPTMLLASFFMSLFAALPDALIAVWLKVLGDGVLQHDNTRVGAAASGLGLSVRGSSEQ